MANTAAKVRDDILGLLGLEALSHGPAGLTARILSDLNRTLQEIYSLHPKAWFSTDHRAEQVRAPVSVTLDVTNGSKTIANLATSSSWMVGCTIVIAGDSAQNMLVKTDTANFSLLKPYQGSTAAGVGGIVYQDVLHPGTDVEQVMAPVMAEGHWELRPVNHERDRQTADPGEYATSGHRATRSQLYPLPWTTRPIQIPEAYIVERNFDYSTGAVSARMRFSALPPAAFVCSFHAKIVAGMTTVTDLADTRTLVPFDLVDSVLLPMVRWKFASWPQFTGDAGALKADYDAALVMLGNLNPKGYTERAVAVGEAW